MKFIYALALFLFGAFGAAAQTELAPMPQGLIGNPATSSGAPGPITPQQAEQMLAPYLPPGGAGTPDATWFNAVTSPIGGCPAAVPSTSTDSTSAIQCQINYIYNTYFGGFLYLPPGAYLIDVSPLDLKGGVTLVGAGIRATSLVTTNDLTVIGMDSTLDYGGIRDMTVSCYQSASATQPCVTVATNVPAIIRDAWLWGGVFALVTGGVDGLYEDVYFNGWGSSGGNVYSTGANWYIRDKIDEAQQALAEFIQGTSTISGVAENHFVESDFSGNTTNSLYIDDGGASTAVTAISDSVLSSPVNIIHSNMTMMSADEFGSTSFNQGNGSMTLVGNIFFGNTTISGSGSRVCAGNFQLNGC